MAAPSLPIPHTDKPSLRATLHGIDEILPPIRYTSREGGEVDFYGASDRIAHALGLSGPLFTGRKASWTHGWTGQVAEFSTPELFVENHYRGGVNLVDREVTAQFLREHGYNALAVGSPITYADETTTPARMPSSLLVFPPHSTAFSRLNATGETLPYVEQLVRLKSRFETIVACVGGPDVLKGNWIAAFERAGIPWVCGAWSHDRNALVRMQRLMRSFEFVTTNVIGSHIAYAAYCGCKVVFHGENRELSLEDVASHPFFRGRPDLVENVRERMFNEAKLKNRFPFLFQGFDGAPDLAAWGCEQLGVANRKAPQEIARLLGWKLTQEHARWRPASELDALDNRELVDRAMCALNGKKADEVLRVTDVLRQREVRLANVGLLRGLALLLLGKNAQARLAFEEELRNFPDNAKAKEWLGKIGGTSGSAPSAVAHKTASEAAASAATPHATPKVANRNQTDMSAFLAPAFELKNCDRYWVRQSILRAVREALPLFHGEFLDIGCGVMPYREMITGTTGRVTRYIGLDIETEIYNADVDLRWDGKRIPLADASVDSAMATEVLEHCPDPLAVLKEARRVLKPGGVFFFTVPYIWPLHDVPYDFFRYTPFALEKLLAEAGFTDVKLQALGGWNASLAQMMGLWLKRAPMNPEARNKWAKKLWPLYEELVKTDAPPTNPKAGDTMATGWTGVASVPATPIVAHTDPEVDLGDLPVVLVRSHEHNYSETFIEDHVNHLSKNLTLLYGYPFPRFLKGGRSIMSAAFEERLKAGLTKTGTVRMSDVWQEYTAGLTEFFKRCGARVALAESGLMGSFVYQGCERAALPYVVHFHGVDAVGRELLSQWLPRYQQFFKTAAALVVVSRAMQAQLLKLGAPGERLVLAPYGVAVNVAELARPETAEPRFVAVGRFVEKKAPQLTLQAFAEVQRSEPKARLTMIGDGPLLASCREWVTANGLAGAVTFAGVQTREQVSRHMAASRVFLQHSITAENGDSEGLPLAVLEAGAHGLPVISTRHAGIPDAVREGVDGFLVDEKDVAGMAAAMLRMIREPQLAAQLGQSFRSRVHAEYSRRVSIERLQAILAAAAKPFDSQTDTPAAGGAADVDPLAAVADDRNDAAAHAMLGHRLIEAGELAAAYCAFGEVQRLTGGTDDTRQLLPALETHGVLDDAMVQSYRARAGWAAARKVAHPHRILVVTNLLPPQEMGGYGRTMWEFSRELLARGHAVRVLTADLPQLERKPTPDHAAFEPNVRRSLKLVAEWRDGTAVREPDAVKRREIVSGNHRTILAAAKEFGPDIVVAGNLDFVGHLFLQDFLDRGIPVLHRLGNALPGYQPQQAPRSPLYCIAGCSGWVNDGLRRNGYPDTRFAVLPPGSPLREYYRAFPPRRDKLRIAFASLLMPYKGAHVLVEALTMLKRVGVDFECTLAGDSTSPDYVAQLRATASQHGITDRLSFPGFLAKKELAALYARTNVLVFPSVFEEPFGKTQIEAMAAGLLVISSGTGGSREIIRDGETGLFFASGDARSLAERLAFAHCNRDEAARLAAAGQESAFRFTTEACVDRLSEIVEELITSAQAPGRRAGKEESNSGAAKDTAGNEVDGVAESIGVDAMAQ